MPANMPRRIKYRKCQRCVWQIKRKAHRGNRVSYGEYGLQSLEGAWITAQQIEAGRVAATQYLQREGRVFIRIFPHKPVSAKPLEVRMGSGKGETDYWAAIVREGAVLYEIGGVDRDTARLALARVAGKMPVRCRMIERKHD